MWTKEQIGERIEGSNKWLERGVLAIYDRQTRDEKSVKDTKYLNGMGFSAFDVQYLSYVAEYLKSGRHLSGQYVEKTRKRMKRYVGQLTKIANGELA